MVKKKLNSPQRTALFTDIIQELGCYASIVRVLSKKAIYTGVSSSEVIIGHHVQSNCNAWLINSIGTWSTTPEGSDFWRHIELIVVDRMKEGVARKSNCRSIW